MPYTLGESAVEGRNYFRLPSNVEIMPGTSSSNIYLASIDQGLYDGSSETLTLTLDTPDGAGTSNYVLAGGLTSASITIDNDDTQPAPPPTYENTAPTLGTYSSTPTLIVPAMGQ